MTPIPLDTVADHVARAKALIFDCDGTLADTMPLHHAAWLHAFAQEGLPCTEEFLLPFAGVPSRRIVEGYNAEFHCDLDPVSFSLKKQHRVLGMLRKSTRIAPVTDIALRNHGRIPMAVASGGTRQNVHIILDAIQMRHLFDVIITADDDVDPKPQPGIFLAAAQRLGAAPGDCLIFEDGEPGFEAAARAGIPAVDVRMLIAN